MNPEDAEVKAAGGVVRREDGKIKVVVDALDKDSQFLNFLQIQGSVLSPDLKRSSLELVQTAPGRYEGTVDEAEASGNYFVNLGYAGPGDVKGVVSTGVSVPYSDEYRELKGNPGTLETIASITEDSDFGKSYRDPLAKAAEAKGLTVVSQQTYEPTDPDVAAQFTEIGAS